MTEDDACAAIQATISAPIRAAVDVWRDEHRRRHFAYDFTAEECQRNFSS